jgi:AhpD family alkylhydroperoxidase
VHNSFQIGADRNRRAVAVVATVCLVLLALLAVAQVAHTHQGVSDADHCPLCIVMHTAAPVVAAAALVALVQIATTAPVLEVSSVTRNWHAQLFTRPPPFAC